MATPLLTDCTITELRLDGRSSFTVWGHQACVGPRGFPEDAFATVDGRLVQGLTAESVRRWADDNGCRWAEGADDVDVLDFGPAQDWLRGRLPVPAEAALNLWNCATDVAHSLALGFHDGDSLADLVHEKLTVANVPRFFGVESYVPVWSPRQLRSLRRVLGEAVSVVRHGVGAR